MLKHPAVLVAYNWCGSGPDGGPAGRERGHMFIPSTEEIPPAGGPWPPPERSPWPRAEAILADRLPAGHPHIQAAREALGHLRIKS